MIDFTDCGIDRLKAYGGSNGKKIRILYQGEHYMLKFPPEARKVKEMSYTNGCISEYLACNILAIMGVDVQKTLLGKYRLQNGVYKTVVACGDFTDEDTALMEFAELKNTCIDSSEEGYGSELASILDAIDTQMIYDPLAVRERFWDMFIADAFLGNFDRHNGNWGFLVNRRERKVSLAPVYDCGSCLYPQLSEKQMGNVLRNETEIEKRIFVFPTSAIKEEGKKINYYEFIHSLKNPDCNAALKRICPKIDMEKIGRFLDGAEISGIYKEFVRTMLEQRKEKVLDASLAKLKKKERKQHKVL